MFSKKKLSKNLKINSIKANKKLGQNFIFDFNILEKIVKSALPLKQNTVVEIGPGPGGLSRAILKYEPKELILIEIDRKFQCLLTEMENEFKNNKIKIIFKDFLDVNHREISKNQIKIFSNLPYYVSTQILFKILPLDNISEVVFTFQKEVGLRLVAKPNTKNYSRLSVITQYACNIKKICTLPAKVFYPVPKVDSIVLKLSPKKNINKFVFYKMQTITKLAFGKRRKTLKNSLSKVKNIEYLLKKIEIDLNARAEELTVDQYAKLCKEILN